MQASRHSRRAQAAPPESALSDHEAELTPPDLEALQGDMADEPSVERRAESDEIGGGVS